VARALPGLPHRSVTAAVPDFIIAFAGAAHQPLLDALSGFLVTLLVQLEVTSYKRTSRGSGGAGRRRPPSTVWRSLTLWSAVIARSSRRLSQPFIMLFRPSSSHPALRNARMSDRPCASWRRSCQVASSALCVLHPRRPTSRRRSSMRARGAGRPRRVGACHAVLHLAPEAPTPCPPGAFVNRDVPGPGCTRLPGKLHPAASSAGSMFRSPRLRSSLEPLATRDLSGAPRPGLRSCARQRDIVMNILTTNAAGSRRGEWPAAGAAASAGHDAARPRLAGGGAAHLRRVETAVEKEVVVSARAETGRGPCRGRGDCCE